MAGTTGLEPAAAAVTGTMIWNFKDLREREGTQKHGKKGKGSRNVPVLFPDSSVGIPKPSRGRIGTDVNHIKSFTDQSRQTLPELPYVPAVGSDGVVLLTNPCRRLTGKRYCFSNASTSSREAERSSWYFGPYSEREPLLSFHSCSNSAQSPAVLQAFPSRQIRRRRVKSWSILPLAR
jgi:hypothetical protein